MIVGSRKPSQAAFFEEIRAGTTDLAVVSFDKGRTNDARNQTGAAGQGLLAGLFGRSISPIRAFSNEDYAKLVDSVLAGQIAGWPLDQGIGYPFPRKSEPSKRDRIPTFRQRRASLSSVHLLRLSTLRSVDSYFHKFRSNICFASRPSVSSGSPGDAWDRQYRYRLGLLAIVAEIYRFHHNWCDPGADNKTPAMQSGLTRGRWRCQHIALEARGVSRKTLKIARSSRLPFSRAACQRP